MRSSFVGTGYLNPRSTPLNFLPRRFYKNTTGSQWHIHLLSWISIYRFSKQHFCGMTRQFHSLSQTCLFNVERGMDLRPKSMVMVMVMQLPP